MSEHTPAGLGVGGRKLWRSIADVHEIDGAQEVQLLEACRAKDRLDKLDGLLRGEIDVWVKLTYGLRTDVYEMHVDNALVQANATANVMKQLIAALRLPDEQTGKRPQYRGPRGAQAPTIPGGKPATVTALARARAARSG